MIASKLRELSPAILYLAGDGNYTHIHFLVNPSVLYATTLSAFARELPEFVRIHKSYLINPNHITNYRSNGRNAMEVQVGKLWLPISRRRIVEAESVVKLLHEMA